MNRLSLAQITWSLAVLLVATGGALAMGAAIHHIVLPILAGVVILAIAANADMPATEPTIMLEESVDIADDPALTAMMEGIDDPLMLIEKGRIVRANRAALRLLGAHVLNEDARIAIRHPAAAERLSSTAPMAEPVSIELVGLGTREQRWQMRIAPVGEVGAMRRMVHLSDRSGAYAAEKMRVDFVANASHELRTPLAGILGFIETLTDPELGRDEETRLRFLKIMDGEARRMQRLVDDLMSLSRIEAEKYRAPDSVIDLSELVAEVVSVFRSSHGDRGRDVVMEIAPSLPPVQGDRAQLSQLLHNLIGNSAKYGRPGSPIQVRVEDGPGGMTRLMVADEGEGIGPDHLPRLTERFYRVDSGRSRAMGGTGLGLAIVKHIVERHRGRLDITSMLGKGTTITVLLPRASAAASTEKADA
ncbi:two-component system phosphate regulon sensor histidine kinase PhoR [Sphingobium fontiphilum]|uniref:histidine kinase n=1 Tax=Sphingobium fontiphilum TaxID=944425 RepID=A0A7W6DFK8_9SPHN|nr:ATP-binding protein [Sphingobium fontiphilum]MBB3981877.1 two-component system phosphate regulon sensor histidine kinase PhoR [Sphingobium fontiphilum]